MIEVRNNSFIDSLGLPSNYFKGLNWVVYVFNYYACSGCKV